MEEDIFYLKVPTLIQKIKHYLISNMGKVHNEASNEEFYLAFCIALRDEIMINWTTTQHSFDAAEAKMIYYLSLEFLPGKFLGNNITNIQSLPLVKIVLKKMGRELEDLINCDPDPGLGNGGLGRLAACFLDSLASKKYPAMGYGLRYQYGIFEQEIWHGRQVEKPDCWLLYENPWELRKDTHAQSVHFGGKTIPGFNSHGEEVFLLEDFQEVRVLPYDVPIVGYAHDRNFSVITLRLWSTKESPKNFELQRYNAGLLDLATENSSLTDVLYPNDNNELGKRTRLKQEFLLVSSSLQDIIKHHLRLYGTIASLPDKVQIQINDTHPALIIAELTRRLVKDFDLPWKRAFEMTTSICNYTNHTVLKEALEDWNENRVMELLPRQYKTLEKINDDFCAKIREKYPNDEEKVRTMSIFGDGQIRMANLSVLGSKKVNGVAELHTEILKKEIFKDFNEMFPDKFLAITNGVTPRRWLLYCNKKLANFITNLIGDNWITNFTQIAKLKNFASEPKFLDEFLEIKRLNKHTLFNFLSKENPIRDTKGKIISHLRPFDTLDVLIDVQVKRFHEYKRQLLLALHLIMLYHEIKENPNSRKIRRLVIIGGKAAPGYKMAKNILMLCCSIGRKINNDETVSKLLKVSVIENYNVSKAEIIMPAADLSEQISTAGMEASGTGNMKLAINGALTIGTEDGANIEMRKAIGDKYWPFAFGLKVEEINALKKKYKPFETAAKHPNIKKALDALINDTLASDDLEKESFSQIYNSLETDHFFVIQDLISYYAAQKKVEALFVDKYKWAETVMHNIAGMGNFSSDEVIQNYATKIWNIVPCPLNPTIHKRVKEDYEEPCI
ncbi:MAG: glycogen/starch/alpha-glucan family phosphorylase [Chlamydiae bacterium]|nr:glycogen/starch/alpha-glucan family phosphorylase [Chlamydiota bacterium]